MWIGTRWVKKERVVSCTECGKELVTTNPKIKYLDEINR